jgi:hypothetical protein
MGLYFSNDRNLLLAKVTLEAHDNICCVSVHKVATTTAAGPCAVDCSIRARCSICKKIVVLFLAEGTRSGGVGTSAFGLLLARYALERLLLLNRWVLAPRRSSSAKICVDSSLKIIR